MDHYQIQAAAAVKRKDFRGALELYSKAILRSESAKLLDLRAACFEAQGNWDAALKDAKKCIQIAKADPLGYIRAGLILQEMDKPNDALQVMVYGLRKVKHAGQSYETLQKAHNRLQLEISPTRCVDPMTILPGELALKILEPLQFRQLMKLRSISRGWSHMINNTPELWRALDLSQATSRRKVRHAFVERAIKSSRLQITHARLNNLMDFDKSLAVLLRTCPIERLEMGPATPVVGSTTLTVLSKAEHLKTLHMQGLGYHAIQSHSLESFWKGIGQQLEELTLGIAPNLFTHPLAHLKILNVTLYGRRFTPQNGSDLGTLIPNLSSLTIRYDFGTSPDGRRLMMSEDLRSFVNLDRVDITCPPHLVTGIDFPSSLKALKISPHITSSHAGPQIFYAHFWANIPAALEELDVIQLTPISHQDISQRLLPIDATSSDARTPLRKLSLNPLLDEVFGGHQHLLQMMAHPYLSKLEHIGLPFATHVDDEVVEAMVQHMPNLTSVNLSNTYVNGTAVAAILKAHSLRELDLSFCHRISNDVVRFARAKDVVVHHKQRDASKIPHERSVRA